MSVLAFNINDFTKKIKTDKYELDKIYALTLDPDDEIDFVPGYTEYSSSDSDESDETVIRTDSKNLINYKRCFIMNSDENGTRIRANDSSVFANAINSSEPVICAFKNQVYRDNCSVVFFKFVPERMFITGRYPCCSKGDPLLKESLYGDIGHENVVRYNAKCDDYIITDDIENVYDITASDATSGEDAKFNADDINDVKFVSVDDAGNKTELDPEIIKIISTCAKIGVIDKDGNFKSMFENDIDTATKQKIQAEFSKLNNDETKTA
jgi:hypothetical protein